MSRGRLTDKCHCIVMSSRNFGPISFTFTIFEEVSMSSCADVVVLRNSSAGHIKRKRNGGVVVVGKRCEMGAFVALFRLCLANAFTYLLSIYFICVLLQ